MKITFLGTTAMVPTKERNHSAVFLEYKGDGILFDCGEGTQRQFSIAGIKITKVSTILITHFHGDHCLGLLGLLQSLVHSSYNRTVEIIGPKHTKKFMDHAFKSMYWDTELNFVIKEVDKEAVFEYDDYTIEAKQVNHGVPCLGFAFVEKDRRRIKTIETKKLGVPDGPHLGKLQEGKDIEWKGKTIKAEDVTYIVPGKKITYISDTGLCENCYKLAEGAEVLICEATHASDLQDKAEKYKHLTAKDAGLIASKANAKKLILTHFSARYKNTTPLQEDAEVVFSNVLCAQDFMKINV